MKSGLEKIILKFHDGLQSCCCPVQKNLPRKAELAWQVSRYSLQATVEFQSQKWCQISVRIFCVLPATKNLQCDIRSFVDLQGRGCLGCFLARDIHITHISKQGAFTYDVRGFGDIFDLPTYPNQILYYVSHLVKSDLPT